MCWSSFTWSALLGLLELGSWEGGGGPIVDELLGPRTSVPSPPPHPLVSFYLLLFLLVCRHLLLALADMLGQFEGFGIVSSKWGSEFSWVGVTCFVSLEIGSCLWPEVPIVHRRSPLPIVGIATQQRRPQNVS